MTILEIVGQFALLTLLGIGLMTILSYARRSMGLTTPGEAYRYLKKLRKEVEKHDNR